MISGKVSRQGDVSLEPKIIIPVAEPNGQFRHLEFALNTGFTGWLVLPQTIIARLGLVYLGSRPAIPTTGQEETIPVYLAQVSWREQLKPVLVHQSIDQYLLGMGLLKGSRLIVDAWEDGSVIIEEIPIGP